MSAADYAQAALLPKLGMYALPYATRWPDLADQLAALYADRTGSISWLPDMWIDSINALHGREGFILVPGPATGVAWLNTPAKVQWWNDFSARARAIVTRYAEGQLDAGRVEMARLNADAAFWDRAYTIAEVLSAPVRGVQALYNNPFTSLFLVGGAVLALILLKRK